MQRSRDKNQHSQYLREELTGGGGTVEMKYSVYNIKISCVCEHVVCTEHDSDDDRGDERGCNLYLCVYLFFLRLSSTVTVVRRNVTLKRVKKVTRHACPDRADGFAWSRPMCNFTQLMTTITLRCTLGDFYRRSRTGAIKIPVFSNSATSTSHFQRVHNTCTEKR